MKTVSKTSSYKKALALLRQEVSRAKDGVLHSEFDGELMIVSQPTKPKSRFRFLTWRRIAVLFSLVLLYIFLVSYIILFQAKKDGITSYQDVRFSALVFTKAMDWLFVTGPEISQRVVNGHVVSLISGEEIFAWFVRVLLQLLGWGSVITIPYLLVNSFVAKAGESDEAVREAMRQEMAQIFEAKNRGRLEIRHPTFSAIFTHTADPVASVLIDSLKPLSRTPWVVVQSGEIHNSVSDRADHVYIPDLASTTDYNNLLHASRLRGNTVVVLMNKPGFKFLADPTLEDEVDLTTSDVVTFIENVMTRTHHDIHLLIVGAADTPSISQSYKKTATVNVTTLATVVEQLQAILVDPDEILVRELYRYGHGKPIYIEFSGSNRRIEIYKSRLKILLARFATKYPLCIVNSPKDAWGGVFYIGDDAEGVALTHKKLGVFEKSQPHFIVFESIDRIDEVEDIGFSPICIDYEVTKELVRILTRKS